MTLQDMNPFKQSDHKCINYDMSHLKQTRIIPSDRRRRRRRRAGLETSITVCGRN